jgi:hypothetical protein
MVSHICPILLLAALLGASGAARTKASFGRELLAPDNIGAIHLLATQSIGSLHTIIKHYKGHLAAFKFQVPRQVGLRAPDQYFACCKQQAHMSVHFHCTAQNFNVTKKNRTFVADDGHPIVG